MKRFKLTKRLKHRAKVVKFRQIWSHWTRQQQEDEILSQKRIRSWRDWQMRHLRTR